MTTLGRPAIPAFSGVVRAFGLAMGGPVGLLGGTHMINGKSVLSRLSLGLFLLAPAGVGGVAMVVSTGACGGGQTPPAASPSASASAAPAASSSGPAPAASEAPSAAPAA